MDYTGIPEELRNLSQWVCTWDTSKIPMKSFERKAASSMAPETWGTFDQALSAVEAGVYDHLGFVFADNGLVGIDIDDGFDEDGLMTPLCADVVSRCQSYTEKSRSGRGVHILLHGDLPFTGRNNLAGVEIYKARRFFIMTGKVLIFDKIADNQEAIDYIVARYFPAMKDSKGMKPLVQKIYTPEWTRPEGTVIPLRPVYPPIVSGGRNISLTSLAGNMHNTGYSCKQIFRELCYVNQNACKPPLPVQELETICNSVTRYRR